MSIEDDDNCSDCHELQRRIRVLRRRRVTAYFFAFTTLFLCVVYAFGRGQLGVCLEVL